MIERLCYVVYEQLAMEEEYSGSHSNIFTIYQLKSIVHFIVVLL